MLFWEGILFHVSEEPDIQLFEPQDPIDGYYVAKSLQRPIAKYKVDDLFAALFERNVELRIVDNLWGIADEIVTTGLNWSLCRMGFAQPRL